jgi:hypothetical protein
MLRLGKKQATSSLHALRRKITLQALARLQPILLLQMLVGISQSVNSSVSRSQTLARTLLLSGQQRLHDLLASAPRLHLSVEQVLEFCRSGDAKRTPEEDAAQALLEVCLGLMLQWMTESARRHRTSATVSRRQRVSSSYFPLCFLQCPPRVRSCLCVPLSR